MKMFAGLALTNLCAVALSAQTMPAQTTPAQTTPAPVTPTAPASSSPTPSLPTTSGTPTTATAPSTPTADAAAPELSKKEQSTLTRCMRLTAQEQAQSSKCGEVMTKAGKGDPAKVRQTAPNVIEE